MSAVQSSSAPSARKPSWPPSPDDSSTGKTGQQPGSEQNSRSEERSRPVRRGTTTLAKTVVEKIASQAASEISAAGGTSGGFLGIGAQTDLSARPKASVELYGKSATVSVDLAVAYPTPIRPATDRVRRHLIERVGVLAGVEVTRVDINVTAFHIKHTENGQNSPDDQDAGDLR